MTTEWPTLAVALVLCAAAPHVAGLTWARTGQQWQLVAGALLGVAAVAVGFRLLGGSMPWSGWQIWRRRSGAAVVTVQVAAALLFGLVAGWLRVETGSVVAPVLAHAVMDAAAVV